MTKIQFPQAHQALATDLYQLTMGQGYLASGRAHRQSIFHMFFRKPPFGGRHVVSAGFGTFSEWLEGLHYSEDDIQYLRSLTGGNGAPLFSEEFLSYLSRWKFSGSIDAVPEGTVLFPYEPLVRVRAPLLDAQLIETTLLCIVNYQSLIATKASRIKRVAGTDTLLEFGLRRAHGLDGGLSASRAAFIGGADATSNLQAGHIFSIPVRGTHAHSWVMAFDDEPAAFSAYLASFPHNSVLLIDTYDSIEGVRNAIDAGLELRKRGSDLMGIRLDSGDLAWLSRKARTMLDQAGFQNTQIIASNDLDERLITSLKVQGAPIDAWGVGTKLATAYDEPALGGVYKLAAIEDDAGNMLERLKLSEQAAKTTIPGCLELIRFEKDNVFQGDMIYDSLTENAPTSQPHLVTLISPVDSWKRKIIRTRGVTQHRLLKPYFVDGKRVREPEPLVQLRARCFDQLSRFDPAIFRLDNPHGYAAGLSEPLFARREMMKNAEFDKIRERLASLNGNQSASAYPGGKNVKTALILVDIQNDFLPGGPLAVPDGDAILDFVVNLIRGGDHYDLLVASQDYHPRNHGSFASNHEGCAPFDVGELAGVTQVFWPDHCVAGTAGADIAEPIRVTLDGASAKGIPTAIIRKGQTPTVDSYSAFFDNNRQTDTGLDEILKQADIEKIDIVGLALDYCVGATARDAAELGYTTRILLDGTRAIDPANIEKLRRELTSIGVTFVE